MVTETTQTPVYTISKSDKKFIGWHVFFAVAALTIGSLFGPLQALQQAGIDWYPSLDFLFIHINDGPAAYYQGLTLHGVLNALIWTTFFITGDCNGGNAKWNNFFATSHANFDFDCLWCIICDIPNAQVPMVRLPLHDAFYTVRGITGLIFGV